MQPAALPLPLDPRLALASVVAPPPAPAVDPALVGDGAADFDVLLAALCAPQTAPPCEQAAAQPDLERVAAGPAAVDEFPEAVRQEPASPAIEPPVPLPLPEIESAAPAVPEPDAESREVSPSEPELQPPAPVRAASLVNLIPGAAQGLRPAPAPAPPAPTSVAEATAELPAPTDPVEPSTRAPRREPVELVPPVARSESLDLPASARESGPRSVEPARRELLREPVATQAAQRQTETPQHDVPAPPAPEPATHRAHRPAAPAQPAPVHEASAPAPAGEPAGPRDLHGSPGAPRALPELPAHGEVEVVRSVRVLAEQGGGRVTIRLDPPQLGGLSLRVVVSDGAVHVSLLADQAPVADLLARHAADLRSALEGHGLRLDRLDVGAGDVDLDSRGPHPREPEERGATGGRAPLRQALVTSHSLRRFDVSTLGAVDLHI